MVFVEVNIYEAKTHLSRLIERALQGEEVTIARAGKPLVRLTPIERKKPILGGAAGIIRFSEDWDSLETNLDIEKTFYGE
jgi:prevent-host-death family protein